MAIGLLVSSLLNGSHQTSVTSDMSYYAAAKGLRPELHTAKSLEKANECYQISLAVSADVLSATDQANYTRSRECIWSKFNPKSLTTFLG